MIDVEIHIEGDDDFTLSGENEARVREILSEEDETSRRYAVQDFFDYWASDVDYTIDLVLSDSDGVLFEGSFG